MQLFAAFFAISHTNPSNRRK